MSDCKRGLIQEEFGRGNLENIVLAISEILLGVPVVSLFYLNFAIFAVILEEIDVLFPGNSNTGTTCRAPIRTPFLITKLHFIFDHYCSARAIESKVRNISWRKLRTEHSFEKYIYICIATIKLLIYEARN